MTDQSLSGTQLILLARLSESKAPKDDQLIAAASEIGLSDEPGARERMTTDLAELRRRRLVKDHVKRLTDEGARQLRTMFRVGRTPTWSKIRDNHIPALALGLTPGTDEAKRLSNMDGLMLAVLRRHTELSKAAKLTDLCDALIAAALKMPPGKLTLALIRSHVLAHHLNVESKGGIADVATHAARRLLGEPDTGKAGPSLRQVLGRRWLYQVTSPLAPQIAQSSPRATSLQTALPGLQAPPPARPQLVTSPPANGSESGPAAISADTLLTLVREAIPQIGSDGRFGPEKVFVSAIWRRIESERRLPDLSLERFKRWLVTANRDQLLDLARADLRGAMDAKLIEESEIRDLGATFHFVVDRQAATAGRGLHAR